MKKIEKNKLKKFKTIYKNEKPYRKKQKFQKLPCFD